MNTYQHIDLEYINSLADGDTSFVIEMIKDYKTLIPEYMNELNKAAVAEHREDIKFFAHKLASSFLFMGAKQLNEISREIEHNIEASMKMEELHRKLSTMHALFAHVSEELDQELKYINASL